MSEPTIIDTDVRLDGEPVHRVKCEECDGTGRLIRHAGPFGPRQDIEWDCEQCEGAGCLTELCGDEGCPLCSAVHDILRGEGRR